MSDKRLTRAMDDRMFLGVAGGLARYMNIDPVLVRLLFVLFGLASFGQMLLVYFLMAIVMPEDGEPVAKANGFDEEEIVIH